MKTYEYIFVRMGDDDGRMRTPKAVEEDLNKNGGKGFRFHSVVFEGIILMEKTKGEESKKKK